MMLSIGSDFEYMGERDGSLFSFEGLLHGTKAEPRWIGELGNVQEDNVLAEAATAICYSKQQFKDAVISMSRVLYDEAAQHGIKIVSGCSGEYPAAQLLSKQASTFGCDTSYNGYTQMEERPPRDVGGYRSAGGHVHVGVGEHASNVPLMFQLAQNMDAFVAVPLMLHADRAQRAQEVQRRRMYGAAGSLRLKEYGIEYRTLSNMWTFDDELIDFVYDATEAAVRFTLEGGVIDPAEVVPVVNDGAQPNLTYFYTLKGWEDTL